MLAVALLALALYAPITLYPPSDLSHVVFRVAVCLAVAQGIAVPRGRLVRWGLALWAAGIVWSAVAAPDPWRALWSTHNRNEGAWQVAHYVALLLVACGVARDRSAGWIAVAAVGAACWAADPLGWVGGRLAGSTGNPLYLAPLLIIGVWGACRTAQTVKADKPSLWIWRALAVLLVLAALATGSKGVFVATIAAGGVLLLAKAPRWAIVAMGVTTAVGIWFVPIPDSGLIRLELGRVALEGIAASPIGWGAEGFPFVWDQFWTGVAPTGESWHDRAHSLVMDRAIEWGMVGVAGWAAVVAAAWQRAELPERMAIAAYLGFGLTMFEMMWGAAGFACLLGYVFSAESRPRYMYRALGWTGAAVALVVGSLALAQSSAASRAADFPAMQTAIEMPSPIGGDIVELYLKAEQTPATLEWAADRVEVWSPHATQQAFLLAIWDRRHCASLLSIAPRRPDVFLLCNEELGLALPRR